MKISFACLAAFLSLSVLDYGTEPIFHEPLDSLKPDGTGVQLLNPSALGDGRTGQAVLLESRTQNLLANAALANDPSSKAWILLEGASLRAGHLVIPQGAMARQVVNALKTDTLHCFSIDARAADGKPARVSLAWDGAETDNTREFDLTPEWTRLSVSGKNLAGSATVTIRGLAGTPDVARPQFESGGTVPTSFLASGQRRVSGLVWTPGEEEFNPTQGTVSFWIKPNWAGETMSSAKTLFYSVRDVKDDWKQMRNVIALNAWLLDREAQGWQYALNLRITDRDLKSHSLSVPLQDLTKGWHHVALTWNLSEPENGRAAIYLDGEVKTVSDHLQSAGLENARTVAFGQGGGGYLDGWLDEAAIYPSELSPEEIRNLAR